jgi:hypothetical protein
VPERGCNSAAACNPQEKEVNMGGYVKNGTPIHGPSLCAACQNAILVRGYRESQEIVVCDATYPAMRVEFAVRECSRHRDTTRQDLKAMEEIAWAIRPRGPKRAAGFVVSPVEDGATGPREIEIVLDNEDDETEPVK